MLDQIVFVPISTSFIVATTVVGSLYIMVVPVVNYIDNIIHGHELDLTYEFVNIKFSQILEILSDCATIWARLLNANSSSQPYDA